MKTISVILGLMALVCKASGCLDVVFSLDVSCSMGDADKEAMRELVTTIVNGFWSIGRGEYDYQVAMLTYDRGVKKLFYLKKYSDKGAVLDAIKNVELAPFDCRRLTYIALDRVRTEFFHRKTGDRANNTNLHIMITDGVTAPSKRSGTTLSSAAKLKKAGIESIVVAFEKTTKKEKEKLESTEEWEAISTVGIQMYNRKQQEAEEMGQEILTAMKENDNITCIVPCLVDIVYILDVSYSIGVSDLEKTISFFKNMTVRIDIGNLAHQTKVAALTYNGEVSPQFKLNEFDNPKDVLAALDKIPLGTERRTRTDLALLAASEIIFTEENGDRPGVQNVIVLATDGRTSPQWRGKKTLEYATAAKEAGDKIFVLGLPNVREKSGRDEWEQVASEPLSDHLFELGQFPDLKDILDQVVEGVCIQE